MTSWKTAVLVHWVVLFIDGVTKRQSQWRRPLHCHCHMDCKQHLCHLLNVCCNRLVTIEQSHPNPNDVIDSNENLRTKFVVTVSLPCFNRCIETKTHKESQFQRNFRYDASTTNWHVPWHAVLRVKSNEILNHRSKQYCYYNIKYYGTSLLNVSLNNDTLTSLIVFCCSNQCRILLRATWTAFFPGYPATITTHCQCMSRERRTFCLAWQRTDIVAINIGLHRICRHNRIHRHLITCVSPSLPPRRRRFLTSSYVVSTENVHTVKKLQLMKWASCLISKITYTIKLV